MYMWEIWEQFDAIQEDKFTGIRTSNSHVTACVCPTFGHVVYMGVIEHNNNQCTLC